MRWKTYAVGALAVSLVIAGCANGDDSSSDKSTATDQATENFSFGQPAASSDADRTIEIDALDDFSFDPATVDVSPGEIVTFSVTNVGNLEHEFTLGDEAVQERHESEMAEMGDMEMDDDTNAISVPPGETVELSWEFADAGTIQFACHTQGHWNSGMHGEIVVG